MKSLAYTCFILVLSALCYGNMVKLNDADSSISCTQSNDSDLRLEIKIGSFLRKENGKLELPPQFRSYTSTSKTFPVIKIHVALPQTGEYQLQTDLHQVLTGINYPDNEQSRSEPVVVSKPYWLRELRGIDIFVSPFSELNGELVIADKITIGLIRQDSGTPISGRQFPRKLNPYFIDIYKHHFINFDYRYQDMAEYGSMAVICPTASYDSEIQQFDDLIQAWVDWKNQKGIPTTLYGTNVTGNTYIEIQAFIQALYDNDPNLTFVQLVGDFNQVPCLVTGSGGQSGGMDAYYTLLEGDDWYPDIFVGRFSAETAAELYTQVKRSIEYERDLATGDWLDRAAGVCSDNPPIPGDDNEHNWEHLDNIRTQLLTYGYSQVDRIYANEGATLQDLVNSLNDGRSLVNYCGEGYPTHWVNPPFSVSDAENLTNTGMLPFIHVVSCWTGQFYNGTCLSEALMRSRSDTSEEARGAIAVYSSAPEQGVEVPMEAQDHTVELLINGTKNTIGGLCYNGSCSMIDDYGYGGVYNFLAWNLFGDASLVLRTKPAEDINAILPNDLPANYANLNIDCGAVDIQVSLTKDNVMVTSGFSGADGIARLYMTDYPAAGEMFLLTLSGFNRRTMQRNLTCYNYNYGDHAILDMTVLDSDQLIETETEIIKTIKVLNRGQIPAENVSVILYPGFQLFSVTPIIGSQDLGQILPGEENEAVLSFKVGKGVPDLATVHYTIAIMPAFYMYDFSEVVHAPTLILDTVIRSPQPNWLKPGDTFALVYKLRNDGSAALRELHGELASLSDPLYVQDQDESYLNIAPGSADSLVFNLYVSPECQVSNILSTGLDIDAANSLGSYEHHWQVIAPDKVMESFESHNLHAFPWLFQSAQWSFHNYARDGMQSLISQEVNADSIWLVLSFFSRQAGEISFHYDLYREPQCNDTWHFFINQNEVCEMENSASWSYQNFPVNEGQNTIRWVGRKDPASIAFGSNLLLDAIQFPAQTIFANASLLAEPDQLDIRLGPGEIRHIPISLSSNDGKYLHYDAVLQKASGRKDRTGEIELSCNSSAFSPGSSEMYMFSLYNNNPTHTIKQIRITLPDKVLALSATSFMMPGQQTMTFAGSLGSFSDLVWETAPGSMADSLKSAVRLLFDTGHTQMSFDYHIVSETPIGETLQTDGQIELTSNGSSQECLTVTPFAGELQDERSTDLVLSANQNLMSADLASYTLYLYYNGTQLLSLPISVRYDEDPPGFHDDLHLTNYPNPIRNSTVFAYSVPKDGHNELTLFNVRGQKVKTLYDGEAAKGYYRIAWNLDNEAGKPVSGGIYFCRLKSASGKTRLIKCVVIK